VEVFVRRFLTIFLVVLAFTGLAACGDDDDATESGAQDDSSTTVDDDTATTKDDSDFSGKGSGDFCDLLREYDKAFTENPDFTDKAAVKAQFEALGKAIETLSKEAPSEIKADVDITVTAFGKFLAALAAADYDFTKVDQAAVGDLDKPEVKAAGERLDKYGEDVCGVTSDADTTTTAP
jgi:hypothetical protein